MKKFMYLMILLIIAFVFAQCGEELLSEKAIKFTVGSKSYTFSKFASAIETKIGSSYQLVITANSSDPDRLSDKITLTATSNTKRSYSNSIFSGVLKLEGKDYTSSDAAVTGLDIEGDLAVKTLTAKFNNANYNGTDGSIALKSGTIGVYYTDSTSS